MSVMMVATPKPSQVYVPTTVMVEATGNSSPGSQKCGNVGVIVGAVIGGFIGLCLVILAWWYVRYVTMCPLHLQLCEIDFSADEGGK